MRERLIKLLDNVHNAQDGAPYMHIDDREALADYILADGWIRPPCKVGDMVWFDTYKKNGTVSLGIQPHKVDRIDIICVVGEKELIETKLHDWYFGESVFLTKEEAENALKAREVEGK